MKKLLMLPVLLLAGCGDHVNQKSYACKSKCSISIEYANIMDHCKKHKQSRGVSFQCGQVTIVISEGE